jgi:hypothetical protein
MSLLGLIEEAHRAPDERFVHPVTLHYLGVDAQRQPGSTLLT